MDVGEKLLPASFFLRWQLSLEDRPRLFSGGLIRAKPIGGHMESESGNIQETDVCDLRAKPMETLGEAFADGSFIEPVHDPTDRDRLHLMIFDGQSAQIASRVQHEGRIYVSRAIDPSVARELHLPAEIHSNESVPELLADLVRLIQGFSGLPDNLARLVARLPLSTWVTDALDVAPSFEFIGPECRELKQLFGLLKCLCRHALLLTEVTAYGLCSLPTELGLTLLINQPELSEPAQRILNAARNREETLPRRGSLWRPFSSKAVHCTGYFQAWAIGAVRIPVIPIGRALPVLDKREMARIAGEFQPRLLSYRFAEYGKVQESGFDNSISEFATRATINSLAACTPEHKDLQAEIVGLVADQAAEIRQEKWTDPIVVQIESLLMSCHTPSEMAPYVGEITDKMKTIFSARGEERDFKPNQVSKMLRHLGLKLEPRDSRGVKLRLTESVRRKIHELAHNFGVPSIENRAPGCSHCAALGMNTGAASVRSDVATSESM